jgi:hypothetical protein
MKRSIFIAVLGMASVAVTHGQGLVSFYNYVASSGPGITYAGLTGANAADNGLGVGPEVSAELFAGAASDTQFSQLVAVPYSDVGGDASPVQVGLGVATGPGAIGTGAGWFNGGAIQVPTIQGVSAGGTYAFAIYAFGTINGVAVSGFSSIFDGTTSATSGSPTPNAPSGFSTTGFNVTPVPEPTTLALAGLGGAALLALRRKKA